MKSEQYDEATWLSRCLKLNSLLTTLIICAMSIGMVAGSIAAAQPLIDHLSDALHSVLTGPR
jgi:uncharacterized protein involved in cysteine biosynthesis